ncbi:MAG: hypothetical protein ABGW69_03545 [Nanoarchaeota archaeon]
MEPQISKRDIEALMIGAQIYIMWDKTKDFFKRIVGKKIPKKEYVFDLEKGEFIIIEIEKE